MDRRLLAIGLAATLVGLVGLSLLVAGGVVRHPADATAAYGPAEYAAIGGSFLALTVGVLVAFRSVVVFPDPEE